MAYFCEKDGLRIAKPGMCKTCDPKNGHEEASEAQPEGAPKKAEKPAEKGKEGGKSPAAKADDEKADKPGEGESKAPEKTGAGK